MSDDGETRDDGWDEHKMRQLVRLARLPFSEKLQWLEDAQELVDARQKGDDRHHDY